MFHTVACSICLGMQRLNIIEVQVHSLQCAILQQLRGFCHLLLKFNMDQKQDTLMSGHIACMV